jgi:hypothetical protein
LVVTTYKLVCDCSGDLGIGVEREMRSVLLERADGKYEDALRSAKAYLTRAL